MRKTITITLSIILCIFFMYTSYCNAGSRKFNMSYIYFGDTSDYFSHVDRAKGQLDEVAPSYFNISWDGNLNITDSLKSEFVTGMHERGIKVVPMLSNHWDRYRGRKALQNREKLSSNVADAVKAYGLDGVNVDIENLTEADRDNLTEFVRLLRGKMPEGTILAVAVAANPAGSTKGWAGSYDYKGLARYSDYLMIMAYDESYRGSAPGPVASYGYAEDSVKYALSRVTADKIVLGIPFYGRYWVNGAGGRGLGSVYIEDLISRFNGKTRFDGSSRTPVAEVAIPEGQCYDKGEGSLESGSYTIWYENEDSLKYKLGLVQKYNLKGTGSWSLGHEPKGTWEYFGLWLTGTYYADIQAHWARDSILAVQEKGLMLGTGGSVFAPDLHMTRAQAAAVLVRMLGVKASDTEKTYFSDTNGHWARNEIAAAAEYGIIKGTGNGRFCPDAVLTRQQMAIMLDRLVSIDNDSWEPVYFRDVNSMELTWSYNAITRMAGAGVFTGYPDKWFRPYDVMTRAQMAVLMDRLSGQVQAGTFQISAVSP